MVGSGYSPGSAPSHELNENLPMLELSSVLPITVYGSSISYFTGKLENYFRIKGIPYTLQPMDVQRDAPILREEVGSTQMPAIRLGDGRFMSDTTTIIQWLEEQFPEPTFPPADPLQQFFCLLLEDYADEWLWRPAMHYRWYYEQGARFASDHLIREMLTNRIDPGAEASLEGPGGEQRKHPSKRIVGGNSVRQFEIAPEPRFLGPCERSDTHPVVGSAHHPRDRDGYQVQQFVPRFGYIPRVFQVGEMPDERQIHILDRQSDTSATYSRKHVAKVLSCIF